MSIDSYPNNTVLVTSGRTAKEYGLKAGVRILQLAAKTKTTSSKEGETGYQRLKSLPQRSSQLHSFLAHRYQEMNQIKSIKIDNDHEKC